MKRLTSHGELWEYVDKLVKETNDKELSTLWKVAIAMYINFHEGWAPREEVERALEEVSKFLKRLEELKKTLPR